MTLIQSVNVSKQLKSVNEVNKISTAGENCGQTFHSIPAVTLSYLNFLNMPRILELSSLDLPLSRHLIPYTI